MPFRRANRLHSRGGQFVVKPTWSGRYPTRDLTLDGRLAGPGRTQNPQAPGGSRRSGRGSSESWLSCRRPFGPQRPKTSPACTSRFSRQRRRIRRNFLVRSLLDNAVTHSYLLSDGQAIRGDFSGAPKTNHPPADHDLRPAQSAQSRPRPHRVKCARMRNSAVSFCNPPGWR